MGRRRRWPRKRKQSREHPRKRKQSREAVLAAVLGAVIGAVGTAVPTIWVSRDQIAAAQQQSEHSFVREQRFQAYMGLINADVELQGYESHCVDEISKMQDLDSSVPPSPKQIWEIHDNIRAAHPELLQAAAKINESVGASPEIIRLARDLVSKEAITVNSMLRQNPATYGQQSTDLKTVRDNIQRSFAAYQAFSRAVGKEMSQQPPR